MRTFLGLDGVRWLALLTASMAILVVVDAVIGHYRSGFRLKVQFVPVVVGVAVVVAGLLAACAPARWSYMALYVAGGTAVVAGLVGAVFHHRHGMAARPGGYRWWLHHLMYGAPAFAPLALSAVGAVGVAAASAGLDHAGVAGIDTHAFLLGVVALSLVGATLQTAVLHFRGAFNNVAMGVPVVVPPLAAMAIAWFLADASEPAARAVTALLVVTCMTGFVGLGMHLRGFERMMGGLRMGLQSLMEGPALAAPALFSGFAGTGLVAMYLI